MKKNKLYTVNKFNKPLFAQGVDREKNILAFGSVEASPSVAAADRLASQQWGASYGDAGHTLNDYMNSKNAFGLSKADNPFSKMNLQGGLGSMLKTPVAGAALTTFAPVVGNALGNAIAGGYESGAGDVVGTVGSAALSTAGAAIGGPAGAAVGDMVGKTLGGLTKRLFGVKTNQALLKIANESIEKNKNYVSNAASFDEMKDDIASMTSTDVYEGGLLGGGSEADEKNADLRERMTNAYLWAVRSQDNNLYNLVDNQINSGLANYASYGGWLDEKPFVRKFADGGLSSAFMDEFGSDPIGAAIRYSRGLEQAAAEREAAKAQAAKEAEYADMQNRLLRLETQNQGMQALMEAQSRVVPEVESPEYSSTPSTATSNTSGGNWGYIESQLRNSGKFSDAQIKGIKYNLQRESGINPDAIGDNNSAFGLGQWHGARKPKDMSLAGQTRYLIDTLSNFDGKMHWLNKNDYLGFMNARTPEEAHYYITKGYERPRADIVAKVKRDSDMSLKHINAFGGGLEEPQDNTRVYNRTILPIERRQNFSDSDYFWDAALMYPAGIWKHKDGTFHTKGAYGKDVTLTQEEADSIIRANKERAKNERFQKALEGNRNNNSKYAFGGELGTNGTDFTNGLIIVGEGGSHEENPLDGVPMGLDPEGIPNLVEEGETIYNDYVFSNRLTVPDFMLKDLGLPKSKKKISFADASKKLSLESEKRPNDPISKAGLDASLARLAEIQETERIRNNAEEYTGLSYALGGKVNRFDMGGIMSWLEKNQASVGNKAEIAKAMDNYVKKYGNPKILPEVLYSKAWNVINKGLDNSFRINPDYKSYRNYDRQRKHFQDLVDLGMNRKVAFGLVFPQTTDKDKTAVRNSLYDELIRKPSAKTVYRSASGKVFNTNAEAVKDQKNFRNKTGIYAPETVKDNPKTDTKVAATPTGGGNASGVKGKGVGATQGGGSTTFRSSRNPYGEGVTEAPAQAAQATQVDATGLPEAAWNYGDPEARQQSADYGFYDNFETDDFVEVPDNETPEGNNANPDPYDTWMRYAPVAGSGMAALSDMFGLTNKPDYTYADKLEAAANAAGYSPNIGYEPIGDYMRYRPMDIWAEQNQLNAQSRATDRYLRNTTSPSRMAGIIANGYNSQLASGDLYRNALEYNDAQRQKVADFNRKTNMFNSQMDLEAAMANARYTQTARQMGLSGLAQAAAMRDQIDTRTSAARSANLTNFFNNLGNIGRENFAMNQINTDRSRHYFGDLTGNVGGYKSKACGGKMKRK